MVKNFPNINKRNKHFIPQLIEYKKGNHIIMTLKIQSWLGACTKCDGVKPVDWIPPLFSLFIYMYYFNIFIS